MAAPASHGLPIRSFGTTAVEDMRYMFCQAPALNQLIGNSNTAAAQNMRAMFDNAPAFNQPIGDFDTAAVKDTSYIFCQAPAFNQLIGNSNTAVQNVHAMFDYAPAFNQPRKRCSRAVTATVRVDRGRLARCRCKYQLLTSMLFHKSKSN